MCKLCIYYGISDESTWMGYYIAYCNERSCNFPEIQTNGYKETAQKYLNEIKQIFAAYRSYSDGMRVFTSVSLESIGLKGSEDVSDNHVVSIFTKKDNIKNLLCALERIKKIAESFK